MGTTPEPSGRETPPELPLEGTGSSSLADVDADDPRDGPAAPAGPTGSRTRGRRQADRRQQATRRKTRDDDEGAELERRVARLEFAEGALTRLRVPALADAEAGRNIVTDIDVLAIDVDLRLRVSPSIHECKSGYSQAGEPDRLFWLSGFQQYLGAERSTLVRRTASRRGRAIADRLGVRLIDYATLEERELAHAWLPSNFAHVGGDGCAHFESRADRQIKALPSIPSDLVDFLRHQAVLSPAYRVVGSLVSLRDAVDSQGGIVAPSADVLAGHALVALMVAAVKDAGRLDFVPIPQLQSRLELALTVGDPDNSHLLDLLQNVDAVVGDIAENIHRAYTGRGASRIAIDVPSLKALAAEVPSGSIEQYLDLVVRLRSNPTIARDILQTVELACFDAIPGDENWKAAAFDHLFTPEHRQLVLAGVRVLGHLAGNQLSQRLEVLANLPFDRTAPALPARRDEPDVTGGDGK